MRQISQVASVDGRRLWCAHRGRPKRQSTPHMVANPSNETVDQLRDLNGDECARGRLRAALAQQIILWPLCDVGLVRSADPSADRGASDG